MRKENVFIYVSGDMLPGFLKVPDGASESRKCPAVVFTNGWGAYHEMYEEMTDAFCEAGYLTLQFETRGSAGPRREYQYCGTEWKDDLGAAISYVWGCPEADRNRIGLAGVSMGGAMTLIQGSVDPRVRALYAMAPYINGEISEKARCIRQGGEKRWEEFMQVLMEDAARMARGYEGGKMPENYSFYTDTRSEPDEELKEVRRKYPLAMTREPYSSTWNVYLYVDALDAARKIRIPTMVTHGSTDSLLRHEDTEALFAQIPCAQKEYHLIEGAEHALPLTAPEESIRYGLEWFGRYL